MGDLLGQFSTTRANYQSLNWPTKEYKKIAPKMKTQNLFLKRNEREREREKKKCILINSLYSHYIYISIKMTIFSLHLENWQK